MNHRGYIDKFSKNLFWDVDTSQLTMDDYPAYIIQRVLEHGQMDLIASSKSVKRCAHSIPFVFHSSAPYHIQRKKITDAITSDSLPRHSGTPKDINALAHIRANASCRWYCTSPAVWASPFC